MEKGHKPRLHVSGIRMLEFCGEQWHRRYQLGEKIPPGVAAIAGSGTHASIEVNLNSKKDEGETVPLGQALAVARDYVAQQFADGNYHLCPEDREAKTADAWRDEAVDTAVGLSGLHHKEVAPIIEPIGVERPWVLEMEGYPFDLSGWIDIEEADRIIDTKTAARAPSQRDADTSIQLSMYGLERFVTEGRIPGEFCIDALVKTKKPKHKRIVSQRDEEDFGVLVRRIENAIKVIEAGAFTPADPGHYLCDPKWCGFYDTCPYARAKTVHAVGAPPPPKPIPLREPWEYTGETEVEYLRRRQQEEGGA